MKQDLKLGLLLTVVLALVLAPRFLPEFEFSNAVSDAKQESPPEQPAKPAPPTLREFDAPPVVAAPDPEPTPGKSDALTTVFPDGYHEKSPAPESKKQPNPPAERKEPPKPKERKKDETLPSLPGVDDGPTFMVSDEKDLDSDDLALPVLFGDEESDSTEVADSNTSKPAAELEPTTESLALPGMHAMAVAASG